MRRALCLLLIAVGAAAAPKKAQKAPAFDPVAPVIDKTVHQYVRDQVDEEGSFTLEDDLLGRSWEATLKGVRTHELRRHADGQVSVCADFIGGEGKRAQPLDVDFVLTETDGEWVVEDVLIHRVGKTARFTYGPKGERVPAKAPKGARRPAVPPGEPGE